MITLFAIIGVFILLTLVVTVAAGVIAISPVLLVLLALPVIDYLVIKGIIKRRKKK